MKLRGAFFVVLAALVVAACGSGSTGEGSTTTGVPVCLPAPDALCRSADLSGVDLSGKSLVGIDLRGANLAGANLSGADLTQAVLIGADLSTANLDRTVFVRATAKNANFADSTVAGASFSNANLENAKFDGVDTSTAVATGANTTGASPTEVAARFLDDDVVPVADVAAAPPNSATATDVAGLFEELTYRISRDRIAPTKAARRYAYVALAAFAASGRPDDPIVSRLNDIDLPADRPVGVDPVVAGIVAASAVARSLFVINADRTTIAEVADAIVAKVSSTLTGDQLATSFAWGHKVAEVIIARSQRDGFTESLKIAPPDVKGDGVWVLTPPNFQPAIDPGWGTVASFFSTSNECSLPAPQRGASITSPFEEQAKIVADMAAKLTDDQKSMARFWDDGRGRTGTPSGHWMVIGFEVAKKKSLPGLDMFKMVAHEMMIVSDTFVGVWREKYKWMVERPVTVLQRSDSSWSSYLMTPAFPEYPSGHSAVSRAAADLLTAYFGDVAFDDPGYGVTEQSRRQFNVEPRSFTSFRAAADEASDSRLYAGIHYPIGTEGGKIFGACISRGAIGETLANQG